MNLDRFGIVGQIQSDYSVEGGDSVNWMGHLLYLGWPKYNIENYFNLFQVSCGGYVRHFSKDATPYGFGAYYKNPWNGCISRDQMTGILAALIKHRNLKQVLCFLLHHACFLFLFSYNTINNGENPKTAKWKWPDLTLFDIWAMELRALGNALPILKLFFWPILHILDLHMLLNTIYVNLSKETDVISYTIKLITSVENTPTLVSLFSYEMLNVDRLMYKLHVYWCGWRKSCDILPLYASHLGR